MDIFKVVYVMRDWRKPLEEFKYRRCYDLGPMAMCGNGRIVIAVLTTEDMEMARRSGYHVTISKKEILGGLDL